MATIEILLSLLVNEFIELQSIDQAANKAHVKQSIERVKGKTSRTRT